MTKLMRSSLAMALAAAGAVGVAFADETPTWKGLENVSRPAFAPTVVATTAAASDFDTRIGELQATEGADVIGSRKGMILIVR